MLSAGTSHRIDQRQRRLIMHSARLDKSQRLQRVLKVLSDTKPHTTRDIIRKASVCAVNSIISELRDNGFKIECQRIGDKWFYWMVKNG